MLCLQSKLPERCAGKHERADYVERVLYSVGSGVVQSWHMEWCGVSTLCGAELAHCPAAHAESE